ncbi:hypothetical protein [Bartonella sp. HY038]|uniref:hypothetical protein n=1 Tax=Bartonella sp. HY038 TaxID=2759660 RepID=UPI0015F7E26F|nr:hypothetical protein [Bartonella sp. HY038]
MDFKKLFDFYNIVPGRQGDRYWIFPCSYGKVRSDYLIDKLLLENGIAINCIAFGFIENCFFKYEKYKNYGPVGQTLFNGDEVADIVDDMVVLKSMWQSNDCFSKQLSENYLPAFQDIKLDFIKNNFLEIRQHFLLFLDRFLAYLNNIMNNKQYLCVDGL